MEQEMRSNGKRTAAWQEFEKMVATIKYELQCLEDNVFHAWMKELKKRLSKMIVPSIVESQSLPGFITSDSGRFLNKLLAGGSNPTFSMDDLLNFLNKVWRAMKCYYLEQSVSRQVLTELLKLLGASAFNDLLMRKNFCSWKRGKIGTFIVRKWQTTTESNTPCDSDANPIQHHTNRRMVQEP
jgi:myosin-5